MKSFLLRLFLLISLTLPCLLSAAEPEEAALQLASPFGEHMVLQRRMPIPVWGWGEAGRQITVTVADSAATTTVGEDGRWRCDLAPIEAGGPYTFTATDGESRIQYDDVLAGEVWICCGQSNMKMGHDKIPDIAAFVTETVDANRPVRSLQIAEGISFREEERVTGKWSVIPPSSAVAAVFACELQAAIDVPVAIVEVAWGSSSLEGWMPAALTEELPHFNAIMEAHLADTAIAEMIIATNAGTGGVTKFSMDPKENARLTKRYRTANIYARTRPNMLYNARLHPLIPMACQGMVYYQGEANTRSLEAMIQYSTSQRAWLELLRQRWGREDWKFLSVMLPGFARSPEIDLEAVDITTWSTMRDHQLKILDLPHTAVACTIDLGDAKDIHPKDKYPIGERLALLARRDTLGETDLLAQGPTYTGMEIDGSTITIRFDHAKGLSTSDGESPKAFWVSAATDHWHRATARIEGERVILTAPQGTTPKHVRYAYAAKPIVNLVNEAGLPAYPFTTD